MLLYIFLSYEMIWSLVGKRCTEFQVKILRSLASIETSSTISQFTMRSVLIEPKRKENLTTNSIDLLQWKLGLQSQMSAIWHEKRLRESCFFIFLYDQKASSYNSFDTTKINLFLTRLLILSFSLFHCVS